jgi:hypothetical protein
MYMGDYLGAVGDGRGKAKDTKGEEDRSALYIYI